MHEHEPVVDVHEQGVENGKLVVVLEHTVVVPGDAEQAVSSLEEDIRSWCDPEDEEEFEEWLSEVLREAESEYDEAEAGIEDFIAEEPLRLFKVKTDGGAPTIEEMPTEKVDEGGIRVEYTTRLEPGLYVASGRIGKVKLNFNEDCTAEPHSAFTLTEIRGFEALLFQVDDDGLEELKRFVIVEEGEDIDGYELVEPGDRLMRALVDGLECKYDKRLTEALVAVLKEDGIEEQDIDIEEVSAVQVARAVAAAAGLVA